MNGDLTFLEKLGNQWEGATEGFCIQAYRGGKKLIDVEVGKTYRYYDWASLTKVIFSTTAWMRLIDQKQTDSKSFKLTDRVYEHVPWFPVESKANLKNLLSHSAGLVWWYPFFKTVGAKTKGLSPEQAWPIFERAVGQRVRNDFKKLPVDFDLKKIDSVYSDLDFFALGTALQEVSGRSLYENWLDVADQVGFKKTDFSRGNEPKYKKTLYAPTETCLWRGRTMQGEVHDENAWSLRGVAPHAGLFGPIQELSDWGLLLRRAMRGESTGNRFASTETTKLFTTRSLPAKRGDWGLGFMMPTRGGSSAGRRMSLKSVGHTGFTGTSIWYDPDQDILIVILANRVYPTRENKAFPKLRPLLHDWVVESIV